MKMHARWVQRFALRLIRRPTFFAIFSVLLLALLGMGLKNLASDYNVRIWFRTTDPHIQKLDIFEKKFGNDESVILAVHAPQGIFNAKTLKLIQELTEKLWLLPSVARVDSLSNFPWITSRDDDIHISPFVPEGLIHSNSLEKIKVLALEDKIIPGYLVDKSGKTALLYASLQVSLDQPLNYQTIMENFHQLQKSYQQKWGADGYEFYLTGAGALNDAFRQVAEEDLALILPLLLLGLIFLLTLVFRNLMGVFLSLLVIGVSAIACFGLAGLVGIKINNITSILPIVLIAIGIADSVHILSSFFSFYHRSKKWAIYQTVVKNFVPTFLTSITTTLGFLGLLPTEIIPVRELGLLASFGTLFTWVITFSLLVPLMIWWPIKNQKMRKKKGHTLWAQNYMNFINHHKKLIVGVFALLTIVALGTLPFVEVNTDPDSYFTNSVPLKTANNFVKKHFGGAVGPEIVVETGEAEGIKNPEFLKKVEQFERWLQQLPYVNKTLSIVETLKVLSRALHEGQQEYYRLPESKEQTAELLFLYSLGLPAGKDLKSSVSVDSEALRISVLWNLTDAKSSLTAIKKIEEKAKELGLLAFVTGKTQLIQRMNDYVVETFLTSIAVSLLLVSTIMILISGSFRMGIFAMIPNILPLLLGLIYLVAMGKDINVGTALVISVCLGIAVDDTIHFLGHFQHLRARGETLVLALSKVISEVGVALVTTTLILVLSLGSFVVGHFTPNIDFGVLCAFILSLALLTDLLLLPSLILLTLSPHQPSDSQHQSASIDGF